MNAKKVKCLRKCLRAQGVAVDQVGYTVTQSKHALIGPIRLDLQCGRAIYQRCKKAGNQLPRHARA